MSTLLEKNTTVRTFDSQGLLTAITDRIGNGECTVIVVPVRERVVG